MSASIKYYSSKTLDELLSFEQLTPALRLGFAADYLIPQRMHLNYDNPTSKDQNTLLVMPAVSEGTSVGVKIVTVNPGNSQKNLPGIQGIYYLCDAISGLPSALIDAKALTNWRTAATSALAASFLAPKSGSRLLMIGTGSLASYLIDAHSTFQPIEEIMVWGRTREKAENLVKQKQSLHKKIIVVDNLEDAVKQADIISAATFSKLPLIKGDWLRPGQHIDLVGSYRPDMREADDKVLLRSSVFVDSIDTAPKESGDLTIPISNNIISLPDIKGDLFQLCKAEVPGRQSADEITLFKSVGHALEDLVAAQLITQMNKE